MGVGAAGADEYGADLGVGGEVGGEGVADGYAGFGGRGWRVGVGVVRVGGMVVVARTRVCADGVQV